MDIQLILEFKTVLENVLKIPKGFFFLGHPVNLSIILHYITYCNIKYLGKVVYVLGNQLYKLELQKTNFLV